MPFCIFDRATGAYLRGQLTAPLPVEADQVQLVLPAYPNERLERWDGADGVRPARQDEIDAYDDEQDDRAARGDIDENRALRALAWEVAERLGVDVDEFRAEVFRKYRRLRPR